jgi:hypothetical protein
MKSSFFLRTSCRHNELNNFYFGVLHPVARTLSRLLEEPSFAATFQGVYFIFYIFAAKI